jgi:L-rhamnose mutarotase
MNGIFANYLRTYVLKHIWPKGVSAVSEANESQASYFVKQADIFQYQSYSHSDDMFIILKSNIDMDILKVVMFVVSKPERNW